MNTLIFKAIPTYFFNFCRPKSKMLKHSLYRPRQILSVPGAWICEDIYTISTWKRQGYQPEAPTAFTPSQVISLVPLLFEGHAAAQLVEALRYKSEGRGFDSTWCHWNFSLNESFRPHYGPEVDSASNRNEYQEYFLGVKAAGAWGWQPYHLHMPIVLKSGSLNILEPSGSLQACNGIALPLPLLFEADLNPGS